MTINVLEDFAGPGGWDAGAQLAGSTARIIGREINADAIAVAEAAGHVRVLCDVLHAKPHCRVCGYIASPPCQTFSTAGKGEGRKHLGSLIRAAQLVADGLHPKEAVWQVADTALDERSVLVLHPLRVVRESAPDWVAMEQVPNALPVFQAIGAIMEERWGYKVRCEVLYAEEYGVPQTRKRCIFVAVKQEFLGPDGEVPWPRKTHSRYHVRTPERLDEGFPRWISMAEALTWGMTHRPYPTVCVGTAAGGTDPQCLGGTGARRTVRREIDEGRWVFKPENAKPDDDREFVAYRNGNQERSAVRPIDAPAPTVHFGGRCNAVDWVPDNATPEEREQTFTHMGDVVRANGTVREVEQPAPTITGALDNGNFRWVPEFNDQSGTPYDPEWPWKRPATVVAGRGLVQNPGATANATNGSTKSRNDGVRVSVREAGILQSFPPDYPWDACKTKTSAYQRAGDAVPPLLAAAILRPILALFDALAPASEVA